MRTVTAGRKADSSARWSLTPLFLLPLPETSRSSLCCIRVELHEVGVLLGHAGMLPKRVHAMQRGGGGGDWGGVGLEAPEQLGQGGHECQRQLLPLLLGSRRRLGLAAQLPAVLHTHTQRQSETCHSLQHVTLHHGCMSTLTAETEIPMMSHHHWCTGGLQ